MVKLKVLDPLVAGKTTPTLCRIAPHRTYHTGASNTASATRLTRLHYSACRRFEPRLSRRVSCVPVRCGSVCHTLQHEPAIDHPAIDHPDPRQPSTASSASHDAKAAYSFTVRPEYRTGACTHLAGLIAQSPACAYHLLPCAAVHLTHASQSG